MASVELYYGLNPGIINCQEAATSGSFSIGDLVKTDSSGQVQLATSAVIFGIAQKGYTGTQATIIPVELIDFNNLYVMAPASASVTAQADVGQQADITFTYSAQYVTSSATGADVEIVGIHPGKAVGTTGAAGGRYIVRFLRTVLGRA